MTPNLPVFLRELLAAPPHAGEGVHNWLFRVSRHLHPHLPASEIVALLESRVAQCGRRVERREIVSAVQDSIPCAWQARSGGNAIQPCRAPLWPGKNLENIKEICSEGAGLADLWELSPIRLEDNEAHSEMIVDHLFPGNPLLCCGRSQSDFTTVPREQLRGALTQLQLIVPSPMTSPTGTTKDGRISAHTLSNTGERRFLIVEFDSGTTDEQAALLIHLAKSAPLVCVVHSGGKSLHGWFFVQGEREEMVMKFFRYAVSLGADRATWTRSQFVRMPDGIRDNGNRQTVFFLSVKPFEGIP